MVLHTSIFALSHLSAHTQRFRKRSRKPTATRHPARSLSLRSVVTHAFHTRTSSHSHRSRHTCSSTCAHTCRSFEGCLQSLPRAQSHRRVHSRIAACACARTQPRHIEHRGHVCNDPAAGAGGLLASTRIEQHGARTLSASQCRQPASSHHTPARPRVVAHYTA